MKKIFYIFLVAGIMSITQGNAQQRFFSIQYSMGFGSGDTKDFVNSASFRGISLEYRQFINPKIGVGFESGWNVFYERRAKASYVKDNQTFTGVQFRYINMVPILAAVDYYFKPEEHINPFVGLGIGTLYSHQTFDMGLYTISAGEEWQFALRPEAGVRVNANPDLDLIVALKYFTGFKTSELASQNYFAFNLGFVFK